MPGGVTGKTPGQIRAAIGRAVVKAGPDAARRRREEAEKDPRVQLWREDAGTAAICGYGLPPDAALAAGQAITTAALDLKAAGLPGTMDQLRARAYLDALLGQDSRPAPASPAPATTEAPAAETVGAEAASTEAPGAETSGREATGAGTGLGRARNGRQRARAPGGRRQAAGAERPAPAGPSGRAGTGPPPAAAINLTIPLTTLLGLTGHPGEAAAFGPIDAALARTLAAHAAGNPATTWCLTVTDEHGHPTAHGCAQPTRHGTPRRTKNPGGPPPGRRTAPADADGSPPGTDTSPPRETTTPASPKPSPPSPGSGPPGAGSGPPGAGTGPPGGDRTWRLRLPGHTLDLTAALEPLAVTECDHRHQTTAHDPGRILRHLVQIRDGDMHLPALPPRRPALRLRARRALGTRRHLRCNTGPRCRHHHHLKQAAGWTLEQHQPGHHTWTTPAGRRYTTGPTTYPTDADPPHLKQAGR